MHVDSVLTSSLLLPSSTILSLPTWGVALLVVGLPLVLILVAVVVVYFLCRAWRNRDKDTSYPEGVSPGESRVVGVGCRGWVLVRGVTVSLVVYVRTCVSWCHSPQ